VREVIGCEVAFRNEIVLEADERRSDIVAEFFPSAIQAWKNRLTHRDENLGPPPWEPVAAVV
jgi:hypothetical protein